MARTEVHAAIGRFSRARQLFGADDPRTRAADLDQRVVRARDAVTRIFDGVEAAELGRLAARIEEDAR